MMQVRLSIDEESIVELCKCRLWKTIQQSFEKPHRHTTIPAESQQEKEARIENAVDVGKYGTHYRPNAVRAGCKGHSVTTSQFH